MKYYKYLHSNGRYSSLEAGDDLGTSSDNWVEISEDEFDELYKEEEESDD